MVTVEGIKYPKDVYEAIDLLHTRVIDNIGEDSPMLEILENAMEGLENVDELPTGVPRNCKTTPAMEAIHDVMEAIAEKEVVKDSVMEYNRRCQILAIKKTLLEQSPLQKLIEFVTYPAMKTLYPDIAKP